MTKPTGKPRGREHGSKNKATIEREERARLELAAREADLQAGAQQIIQARRLGQKLAKDVLEDLMNLGVGVAAFRQPAPPGAPRNPNEDEEKFWRAAEFARDCATALANYQSPKYKAVVVHVAQEPPQQAVRPDPAGAKVVGKIGNPARVYAQLIGKVG